MDGIDLDALGNFMKILASVIGFFAKALNFVAPAFEFLAKLPGTLGLGGSGGSLFGIDLGNIFGGFDIGSIFSGLFK